MVHHYIVMRINERSKIGNSKSHLITDIEKRGVEVTYTTLEIVLLGPLQIACYQSPTTFLQTYSWQGFLLAAPITFLMPGIVTFGQPTDLILLKFHGYLIFVVTFFTFFVLYSYY